VIGPVKLGWMGGVAGYLLTRNLAFKHAPGAANALMRLTNVSGRGRGRDGKDAIPYFEGVARDYEVIARTAGLTEPLFKDRRVLELGPGNTQAVALLARARGAARVAGGDAVDVLSRDRIYLNAIYEPLLDRMGENSSPAAIVSLLADCKVHATREALEKEGPFDLCISRAVLEHVRDLEQLHRDIEALTTRSAVVIHKVDLRSHGFQLTHDLDFLLFPEPVWRGLTTHIGEPNRARFNRYFEIGKEHGLVPIYASSTRTLPKRKVDRIRPKLASPYREMSSDVLSVLGFWVVQVRQDHPLAAQAINPKWLDPAPHDALAPF
jgi:SAM-dependent methyltransferase